jgi:hypothetical protein
VVLHALAHGLPVPIGTQDVGDLDTQFTDADVFWQREDVDSATEESVDGVADSWERYAALAAQAYERFEREQRTRFKWLRPGLFTEELAKDLRRDAEALLGILDRVGPWNPDEDAKLDALCRLIQDRHPGEKILVFSQFADTVDYLATQLRRRGVEDLAGVTAGSPDPTRLAWRFSPKSNGKVEVAAKEGELRVLIATDVLSEGQNLQDAAIIVNYDLPWAIIRLMQRAGRVDRIGQNAPQVLCYSFMPAEGLERIINLRGRIRRRLQENAEVVGTDEAFFEDDEDGDRPLIALYHEQAGVLDEPEDLGIDPTSEAYQLWKNAIEADPKVKRIVEALPDVVYATRAHTAAAGAPNGVLVFVRTGDGNDALGWVDERGEVVSESTLDVLRAATCEPATPALARSEDHHKLVDAGVRHIIAEQSRVGGQLGKPSGARYRVYQRLRAYVTALEGRTLPLFGEVDVATLKSAIQDIYDHPLREGARDRLNRLLATGASDETLAAAAIELREGDRLSVRQERVETAEPRIICSMGLTRAREGWR